MIYVEVDGVEVDKRLFTVLSTDTIERLKGLANKCDRGVGSVEKFVDGDYYYEIGVWRDILGHARVSGFPFLDTKGRAIIGGKAK